MYTPIVCLMRILQRNESIRKETLIQLLRLFDERIIGIEIGMLNAKPTILIELENIGLMPVSLFGDGLKKFLHLRAQL